MYEKRCRPDVELRVDMSPSRAAGSQMSSSSSSLSKFIIERSLPGVVQVLAGCYGNISVNKDNELYVHSTLQQRVVVAETLTVGKTTTTGRSARRPRTSTGQTLSLPLDYDGWFELMSIDGRTAPMMTSVRQLVDVFPPRCLVRKIINVMTIDDISRGDGSRSRRLSRGEILTLVRVTGQRLLQCRDDKGCDLYLPLNQRGLFSAINGHSAASVFNLRSLLAEFRLPIVVRLVCGSLPARGATAGDMRLVGIQTDRVTFVLPLRHAWTSTHVDRRALIAVPSRQASQLTVVAAAREFYYHWVMSDDGLELMRRCDEIVASWKTSVHVVSSTVAAAAAAAASTAVTRSHDGDDATWSRGPIESSVDSGLASSASSPTFACIVPDNDDDVGHLEREIDDIYAMIRYGGDGVARGGRARSLDDIVSGGELFHHKPTLAAHSGRRPSADNQTPAMNTKRSARRKHHDKVARSPSPGVRKSSAALGGNNVQLVGVSLRTADHTDNNLLPVDYAEVSSNSDHLSDPDAMLDRPPHYGGADELAVYDELTLTTQNTSDQRARSKSLPTVTDVTSERRDRKTHKSVLGTITRSIANAFRRIRPHKASHTFTVDTGMTTYASERYSRKAHDFTDCSVDNDENL